MKFIIRNIGTIDSAEIELNNLSVISGENNSGKTTISKIIYAVGQASSSFPIDYKRHQYNEFRRLYDEITMNMQRLIRNSANLNESEISNKIMSTLMDIRRSPEVNEFDLSVILSLIEDIKDIVIHDNDSIIFLKRIDSILVRLKKFYYDYDHKDPIDKFIFRALKNEFSDELLNKNNKDSEAYLSLIDSDNIRVFEILFNEKEILSFSADYNILPIKDSTLIEGPYIFQLAPMIHEIAFRDSFNRKSSKINPRIPYHILDLCSKLDGSMNLEFQENSSLYNWNLAEFYEGHINFEKNKNNFELIQNDLIFNVNNVSSGMKSIAILDLLCRGRFINKDSILIIDEPETNLHPKWQKMYAKALIKLANLGAHILVNTHSPYMLEALNIYSKSSQKDLGAKYYFSKKIDNKVIINDTNGNIVPIIETLSEPLYALMEELEDVDNF